MVSGGVGMALGLIFLPVVFFPVLAFGSAQYGIPETHDPDEVHFSAAA